MKKTVILYNPAAQYYTLPLQFLALAALLDQDHFDIRIIDARTEKSSRHAHEKLLSLLPQAACVGISVITGSSIKDAVAVTNRVKRVSTNTPVVWGGWHPSIYPEQCLREGLADYCVIGQGEITFSELLETIESGKPLDSVHGIAYLSGGKFVRTPDRKFVDINNFPAYDYDILPIEAYFALKGIRQIDFYSSQGCPYRCAFCADPYIYNRRWSGLRSPRMISDVFDVVAKYRVDDVLFQDENFFANKHRVLEFSKGISERNMKFTWAATSRADQIAPLDDDVLETLRTAHMRKVLIGAESGSQEILDLMKKDTLAEEAIISAEKLTRHHIGASFNFIVGFPEEGFQNTHKTIAVIKEIKRINPKMEFNVFFFTPYPGTALFDYIVGKGYRVPQSLSEWNDIDFTTYSGYWLEKHEREYVDRFRFYAKLATEYKHATMAPIRLVAKSRLRYDYYGYPIEKQIIEFVKHNILRRQLQ
jgi:radical SAM superfamily enzyme YgiQ (UPF0313 family)